MSCFITLEGIEGSGKSTLSPSLAEAIRAENIEVVTTREPGSTTLGLELRNILLSHENQGLNPIVELLLFAADRADHVSQVIKPALARGAFVICDRYIHSTIAYQGYGRGLNIEHLSFLNKFVTGGLNPDLVLLLDLEPETGLARARGRSSDTVTDSEGPTEKATSFDRLDAESLEFHTAVRNGYLELAKDPRSQIITINAAQTEELIVKESLAAVKKFLQ